jgi:hypothetical protein
MRKRNDFATLVFTREAMEKFGLKKKPEMALEI